MHRLRRRQIEELQDRREDVHVAHRSVDRNTALHAGADDHQRDVDLVQTDRMAMGEKEIVFAEGLAVIGGDHDKRVFEQSASCERVEESPEFAVGRTDLAVIAGAVFLESALLSEDLVGGDRAESRLVGADREDAVDSRDILARRFGLGDVGPRR